MKKFILFPILTLLLSTGAYAYEWKSEYTDIRGSVWKLAFQAPKRWHSELIVDDDLPLTPMNKEFRGEPFFLKTYSEDKRCLEQVDDKRCQGKTFNILMSYEWPALVGHKGDDENEILFVGGYKDRAYASTGRYRFLTPDGKVEIIISGGKIIEAIFKSAHFEK